MAQLAERSHSTPEIRGSNPDIGNISNIFICQLLSRKDKNKEKEARNGPFKAKCFGSVKVELTLNVFRAAFLSSERFR